MSVHVSKHKDFQADWDILFFLIWSMAPHVRVWFKVRMASKSGENNFNGIKSM